MDVPPIRIFTKTIVYYPVNFTVLQELKKVNVIYLIKQFLNPLDFEFSHFQMKAQVVMKTDNNNYKTLLNVTLNLCDFAKQIDGNILLRIMVGYQMQKIKIQCPLKKVRSYSINVDGFEPVLKNFSPNKSAFLYFQGDYYIGQAVAPLSYVPRILLGKTLKSKLTFYSHLQGRPIVLGYLQQLCRVLNL